MRFTLVLSTLFFLLLTEGVSQHEIRHGVLPALGYTSDTGLIAGGSWQIIQYTQDKRPYIFLNRLQPEVTLTGKFALKNTFENWFQNGNRLWNEFLILNNPTSFYFEPGNNSSFERDLWKNGYYEYGRFYISNHFVYGIELPVQIQNRMEWLFGVSTIYQETRISENTSINDVPPENINGGFYGRVFTGLTIDARNSVFRPEKGFLLDIRTGLAPAFTNRNNSSFFFEGSVSGYYQIDILLPVVFAGRLKYQQVTGSVDYFAMPILGGQYTLRGFPFERFRDNGYILANLEARTWLFSLPFWEIEAGGHVFIDAGRVFHTPGLESLTSNYKLTWGIGGIMAIFNPDFLIRGDLGFSNEIFRINVGIGYLF